MDSKEGSLRDKINSALYRFSDSSPNSGVFFSESDEHVNDSWELLEILAKIAKEIISDYVITFGLNPNYWERG